MRFEGAGVLPNLRKLTLRLWVNRWGGSMPAGTEHLLSLQHIHVETWRHVSSSYTRMYEMRRFLINYAEQIHSQRPTITVQDISVGSGPGVGPTGSGVETLYKRPGRSTRRLASIF
ncbi:unnamed protein product [Urochloa humidicola]